MESPRQIAATSGNATPGVPGAPSKSAWPRVTMLLGILALFLGAGMFIVREVVRAPAAAIDSVGGLVKSGSETLRSTAEAFRTGTIRMEFLSHAAEVTGTSRFQFATLKQGEVFKREESGSAMWGWVALPKVVVQAEVPVEYSYYLDFNKPWEFRRERDTVLVLAPGIEAGTPAPDVSALTFYTLEGSIWRDAAAVRERLRSGLTPALHRRAQENVKLVREIGRQRLAEFVETWLRQKFGDSENLHVKVIFADETPPAAPPASAL